MCGGEQHQGGWHRAEVRSCGERRAGGLERQEVRAAPRPVTMGTGSPDRAPHACAGGRRGGAVTRGAGGPRERAALLPLVCEVRASDRRRRAGLSGLGEQPWGAPGTLARRPGRGDEERETWGTRGRWAEGISGGGLSSVGSAPCLGAPTARGRKFARRRPSARPRPCGIRGPRPERGGGGSLRPGRGDDGSPPSAANFCSCCGPAAGAGQFLRLWSRCRDPCVRSRPRGRRRRRPRPERVRS